MAETVVINIEFGDSLNRITQIRNEIDLLSASNDTLRKQIESAATGASEFADVLDTLQSRLDDNLDIIEDLKDEYERLIDVMGDVTKAQSAQTDKLNSGSDALKRYSEEYQKLSKPTREQTTLLNNMTRSLQQQQAVLAATGAAMSNAADVADKLANNYREAAEGTREFATAQQQTTKQTTNQQKETRSWTTALDEQLESLQKYVGDLELFDVNLSKTIGSLRNGISALKNFRVALISTGIGLVVEALNFLAEAFMSTQVGIDAVNKVLTPLKLVFERIKNVVEDLTVKAFGKFTEAIDNPKQALKDLANIIIENVINRIKAFQVAAEGLMQIFSGDFSAGLKTLGNSFIQFQTGITGGIDKIGEFGAATSAVVDEAIQDGKRIAAIEQELAVLEASASIQRTKKLQQYEDLKKITDDNTKSEEERLNALNQAEAIQRELLQKQLLMQDMKIEKFQLEHKGDMDLIENQKALNALFEERLKLEYDSKDIMEDLSKDRIKIVEDEKQRKLKLAEEERERLKRIREEQFEKEMGDAEEAFETARKLSRDQLDQGLIDRRTYTDEVNKLTEERLKKEIETLQKFGKDYSQQLQQLEQMRDDATAGRLQAQLEQSKQYYQEQQNIELENLNNKLISEEEYENRVRDLKIDAMNDQLLIMESFGEDVTQLETDLQTQLLENQREYNEAKAAQDEEATQKAIENNQKIQDDFRKSQEAKLAVANSVADSLGSILELTGKQGAGAAAFQKVLALYQVGVDTAKSIAAGIAGATSSASATGPGAFVATPIFIATTIATILGAMAQAITILKKPAPKAPSHAEGGEVSLNVGGHSHAAGGTLYVGEDGNMFEVERGEKIFVLKKTATDFIDKYSTINQLFGGRSWTGKPIAHAALGGNIATSFDGGIVARTSANNIQNDVLLEAVRRINMQPVVRVTEINRVQRNTEQTVAVSEL